MISFKWNKFCLLSVSVVMNLHGHASEILDKSRIIEYNSKIPPGMELRERILTTVYCRDCDDLPKSESAGRVVCDNNECYQFMHNGIKILPDCYYGKWMTLLIELLEGHHEPQEEKAFDDVLNYLPPSAVMVELGSYWGYYSMWFQKQIPGAITYLIEPDEKSLVIGKKNFSLNHLEADFTHAMIGSCSTDQHLFTNWDYETSLVSQVSIDDFAKTKQIPYIHILHSDIQGAEVDMLEGCKELIAEKRIGFFFISTHRGTHEKCLQALENTDYEILLSITREESYSADGLIVAKAPETEGPSTFNISKRTVEQQNFIKDFLNEKTID